MKKAFLEKLEDLKNLHLPIGQYLIWGSGPLAIRGIREAHDVDVLVSQKLWQELIQKFPPQGEKKNLIKIATLEIWKDCLNLTDKIEEMIQKADLIEGFAFMKFSYTIEWKEFMAREKDFRDIALIEQFCKKNSLFL